MGGIAFFDNINMLVLASIVAAVLLAFVLVVMVFSVRLRSWQERNRELKETIEVQAEKIALLDESLNEVRVLNASQLQELGQQEEIKEKLKEEITKLEAQLKEAQERIEKSRKEIMALEKNKSELGANFANARETIVKLEEALTHATKRNEFWVEQMAEVRTKYEALKLKVR